MLCGDSGFPTLSLTLGLSFPSLPLQLYSKSIFRAIYKQNGNYGIVRQNTFNLDRI